MVKQLNSVEDAYLKGLIDSNSLSYNFIKSAFKKKFNRKIGHSTINSRIF